MNRPAPDDIGKGCIDIMKILYTPLTMENSEEFYHLAGNERVAATMRFDCPHTKEESDRVLADYLSKGNHPYALRSEPDGELWGIFVFKGGPETDTADLSQMLLPEKWGHGLGNQIVHDMVELARKEKWYKALEGYVLETNTASRRMAEKSGFREIVRYRFPGMKEDLIKYRLVV